MSLVRPTLPSPGSPVLDADIIRRAREIERQAFEVTRKLTVVNCDVEESFNNLTQNERLYAHYMSKAVWYGFLIVPVQISIESPLLFALLHDLFRSNTVQGVKEIAMNVCNYSEDDWTDLLSYASVVFQNGGNYDAWSLTKRLPRICQDKFEALILNERIVYVGFKFTYKYKWNRIKDKIYSLREKEKVLGRGEIAITTYCNENFYYPMEASFMEEFMKSYNIQPQSCRFFKHLKNPAPMSQVARGEPTPHLYEIRLPSAQEDLQMSLAPKHEFEGAEFVITSGDYYPQLREVTYWLGQAKNYTASETQKEMLDFIIDSFFSGSVVEYKKGTKLWLEDQYPSIEAYLGFLKNVREPLDPWISQFEGHVFIQNKERTAIYQKLISKSKDFLSKLPWPPEFEREELDVPILTVQDPLAFGSFRIYDSTTLPNSEQGQKGTQKRAILPKISESMFDITSTEFISSPDVKLYQQYHRIAYDIFIAIKETLGHGSGALLMRYNDGTANYTMDLINPITKTYVASAYEEGETFESLFTNMAAAMEICRAECVALILILDNDVLKIFGYEGEEAAKVKYVTWLNVFANGLRSLRSYRSVSKEEMEWRFASEQAKFMVFRVLLDCGALVKIEEIRHILGSSLRIQLTTSEILTSGVKIIRTLLRRLQIYRACADVQSTKALIDQISRVRDTANLPILHWRKIVMKMKYNLNICAFPNTVLTDDGNDVKLVSYPPSLEGFIQSWLERYDDPTDEGIPSLYAQMTHCWEIDKPYFTDLTK